MGDKRNIVAADLDQDTLKAGTEVTVWSQKVPDDKVLFWGHGRAQREYADAFVFAELLASGNGTGTAGDELSGELVLAITDSQQRRVLASTVFDTLGELADAKADDRTNRPIMAALAPYAKPGRHIEIRIRAASGSDGKELDPSASSARLYYSEA
ncbi:hypothetical protein [Salinibaculum marinum]